MSVFVYFCLYVCICICVCILVLGYLYISYMYTTVNFSGSGLREGSEQQTCLARWVARVVSMDGPCLHPPHCALQGILHTARYSLHKVQGTVHSAHWSQWTDPSQICHTMYSKHIYAIHYCLNGWTLAPSSTLTVHLLHLNCTQLQTVNSTQKMATLTLQIANGIILVRTLL